MAFELNQEEVRLLDNSIRYLQRIFKGGKMLYIFDFHVFSNNSDNLPPKITLQMAKRFVKNGIFEEPGRFNAFKFSKKGYELYKSSGGKWTIEKFEKNREE